jgi:hypothetical protein
MLNELTGIFYRIRLLIILRLPSPYFGRGDGGEGILF